MYRKFMQILEALGDESIEEEADFEDLARRFEVSDINLFKVNEELRVLEKSRLIGDEEADSLRSLLVYVFAKNTDLETEDIYALVYGEGRRVLWH